MLPGVRAAGGDEVRGPRRVRRVGDVRGSAPGPGGGQVTIRKPQAARQRGRFLHPWGHAISIALQDSALSQGSGGSQARRRSDRMKEPVQPGPASRGTSPCNGAWSLARAQLGVGELGSRGERQRAR